MMLGEVYEKALKAVLTGKASVYHYADELKTLWSDKEPAQLPIVIVWDRSPLGENADDCLLEKHLTPLDWALAWSLKRVRDEQTVPPIVVIDATAGAWKDTWAWSVRHQLLADMPWVTLSAPLVRKEDEPLYAWALSKAAMDSKVIATDGVIRKGADGAWGLYLKSSLKSPDRVTLEGLNKLWAASLKLSDEHHDVNNIVGARVMLEIDTIETALLEAENGNIPDQGSVVRAFLAKARWLGFTAGEWDWALPDSQYIYGKKISAILIDDKYASGWEALLSAALGDSGQLRAVPNPDELIAFLEKQNDTFKRRDFMAGISGLDENQDAKPEIIFLDLRLYGSGELGRLKRDVKRLLAIVSGWEGDKPAWERVPADDLKEIQSWLELGATTNGRTHLKALLLLPQLLALALPLTPIILFSATGQAEVQKILKPYRNIFTNFQKPNPLADPASVQAAMSALHQALDFALPLLQRRIRLAYAQSIHEKINKQRPANRSTKHIELYFDEAGRNTSGIISTGVLAVFPGLTQADSMQELFLQKFEQNEMSWLKNSAKPGPLKNKLKKTSAMADETTIKQQAKLVKSIVKNTQFDLVSAKCRRGALGQVGKEKSLGAFGDQALDESIRLLIEYVLIIYLTFQYSDETTISIFLPTRTGDTCGPKTTKRFGTVEGQTYNKYSAFPLIRGWLQGWGDEYDLIASRIMSTMSRQLTSQYHSEVDSDEFMWGRALHDLADWGAGFVGYDGDTTHEKSKQLRNALGGDIFHNLYHSQADLGGVERLRDVMMTLLRDKRPAPAIAIAISQLCRVPIVENIGNIELDVVWKSRPQEHYWLWRIFLFIEAANGSDLLSGLTPLGRPRSGSWEP